VPGTISSSLPFLVLVALLLPALLVLNEFVVFYTANHIRHLSSVVLGSTRRVDLKRDRLARRNPRKREKGRQ
jgi:hypothetical protein